MIRIFLIAAVAVVAYMGEGSAQPCGTVVWNPRSGMYEAIPCYYPNRGMREGPRWYFDPQYGPPEVHGFPTYRRNPFRPCSEQPSRCR